MTVSSHVNKLTEWLLDDSTIRVYFLLLHLGTFWTFSLEVICFEVCITFKSQNSFAKNKGLDIVSMLSFKTTYLPFQQVAV